MAKKSTNETKKREESKKGKKSERSREPKKDSRAIKIEVESTGDRSKKEENEEIVFAGPFSGNPSLIQSNFGLKGNFELVVPLSNGGLAHYWRNNDDPDLPWYGPVKFGGADSRFNSSSLIQSNFGSQGNLELAATEESGKNLAMFWRDSGPSFDWHGQDTYRNHPKSPCSAEIRPSLKAEVDAMATSILLCH